MQLQGDEIDRLTRVRMLCIRLRRRFLSNPVCFHTLSSTRSLVRRFGSRFIGGGLRVLGLADKLKGHLVLVKALPRVLSMLTQELTHCAGPTEGLSNMA